MLSDIFYGKITSKLINHLLTRDALDRKGNRGDF